MKNVSYLLIIFAVLSFAVGLISRLTAQSFQPGLVGHSFLEFTNTCLLFVIALAAVKYFDSKS